MKGKIDVKSKKKTFGVSIVLVLKIIIKIVQCQKCAFLKSIDEVTTLGWGGGGKAQASDANEGHGAPTLGDFLVFFAKITQS